MLLLISPSERIITGCGSLHDTLNGIIFFRCPCSTVDVTARLPVEGQTTVGFRFPGDHLVTSMPEFLAEENPCSKYIDLKCKELVFLITNFYPLPQLSSFFYPISTYTESFHYFVMQNYSNVKNVEEFAHLGGYTTTTFRRLFKNLYGVPVYEWILEKKREGILEDLQHTKMRITEICNRYGFDSLSHFAHFCKDSFGDTPRALRKKAAGGEKIGKVQ